jgi:putative flippase GtrA
MNSVLSQQFVRFVLANTVAAGLNVLTRFMASYILLDAWAVLAGFCVGLLTSYLLCRSYVFRATRRASITEMARFIVINLLALGITWCVYHVTLQWILTLRGESIPSPGLRTCAHAFGVAAPVFFSFLAQKTYTFRQRFRSNGT